MICDGCGLEIKPNSTYYKRHDLWYDSNYHVVCRDELIKEKWTKVEKE